MTFRSIPVQLRYPCSREPITTSHVALAPTDEKTKPGDVRSRSSDGGEASPWCAVIGGHGDSVRIFDQLARSLTQDYRGGMAVGTSAPGVSLELRGFVERYVAAWNGCDTDAIAQLITDDVVWADPALPEPARGVDAVQEFMRTSFRAFPDLRFGEPDPPAFAVTGDVVLWAWHMQGTHRGPIDPPGFAPTGRTMWVDGIDQWTMRDGRIARYRAFYDMNDVARQLGIVPAAGSRAERAMAAVQRLQARLSRR